MYEQNGGNYCGVAVTLADSNCKYTESKCDRWGKSMVVLFPDFCLAKRSQLRRRLRKCMTTALAGIGQVGPVV